MLDAPANPFRGLLWGCFISGILWLTLLGVGVPAVRWIINLI